jgi:hypothetical protein
MKNVIYLMAAVLSVAGTVRADVDLLHDGIGFYRVYGTLANGAYDNSPLTFTSQTHNGSIDELAGFYDWSRWGTYLGREYFAGSLDLSTMSLNLQGYLVVDAFPGAGLEPWSYVGTVASDGLTMGGIWPHYGGEPGAPWSAEYIPEPATLFLLTLGGLLLRKRKT